MLVDKLENYEALLVIRQKALRRDAATAGGLFFLSVLSTFVIGLLYGLNGRSIYVIMVLLIAFGFSYVTCWVKLETVKCSIELLQNLRHAIRESPK